jgi:hypothetical protein
LFEHFQDLGFILFREVGNDDAISIVGHFDFIVGHLVLDRLHLVGRQVGRKLSKKLFVQRFRAVSEQDGAILGGRSRVLGFGFELGVNGLIACLERSILRDDHT